MSLKDKNKKSRDALKRLDMKFILKEAGYLYSTPASGTVTADASKKKMR